MTRPQTMQEIPDSIDTDWPWEPLLDHLVKSLAREYIQLMKHV